VLEDCSHAHGATCDGVPVGSVGDVSVFSVGGLKTVSGGMGGVVAFRDPAAYEIACLFTSFRQRPRASVHDPALRAFADVGLGGNLRISPIAALLASSHLRRLPELVAVKDTQARAIAAAAELPGVAGVAVSERGSMGGWYDLVVRLCPQAAPQRIDRRSARLRTASQGSANDRTAEPDPRVPWRSTRRVAGLPGRPEVRRQHRRVARARPPRPVGEPPGHAAEHRAASLRRAGVRDPPGQRRHPDPADPLGGGLPTAEGRYAISLPPRRSRPGHGTLCGPVTGSR